MLTFEEKLKLKVRSGFDSAITHKSEIVKRREMESGIKKFDGSKGAVKKMPKVKFSKLPVSVVRDVFVSENKSKPVFRDPRFASNQEFN